MVMSEMERRGMIYRRIIKTLSRLPVKSLVYTTGWLIVELVNGSIFKTRIQLEKEDLQEIKEKLNLA